MTTGRVVSYDLVTTTKSSVYDQVTTTESSVYNLVTTTKSSVYDPVTTTRVVGYDLVTTLTDDSKLLPIVSGPFGQKELVKLRIIYSNTYQSLALFDHICSF